MNTTTLTTTHLTRVPRSRNRRSPEGPRPTASAALAPEPLPKQDIERLVVRVAADDERDSIAELATRAASPPPTGALMVGALDGRLLAAVSISNGHAVSEPTPSGAAAAAVISYRLAALGRRRRPPRKTGTAS
jgi:hypothetical protein